MKITIVGAGPAGLFLALRLVQLQEDNDDFDFQIIVYDKRPDPRTLTADALRTYPISLQEQRGIAAAASTPGLVDALAAKGKWISNLHFNGTHRPGRRITRLTSLSLDRNNIILALLECLEKNDTKNFVQLRFERTVDAIDVDMKTITVRDPKGNKAKFSYEGLVAADGLNSIVRQMLADKGLLTHSVKIYPDEYKSLYLQSTATDTSTPSSTDQNSTTLSTDSFQAWMKGGQRVIMGPNTDEKSFSGVFVFPKGECPFDECTNGDQVLETLREKFSPHMAQFVSKEEAELFLQRPVSSVSTV